MIDEISNVSSQPVITSANNTVFEGKTENDQPDKSDQRAEQTTNKNVIENGSVIVEQYDRHGRLIRKTPPGYLPPGETG